MLVPRRIRVGDTIAFDYDTPKQYGHHRVGQLIRMRRSKKNSLLVYTVLDRTAGNQYRQFHYASMRNIKITPRA